jgi:hypothetical protein
MTEASDKPYEGLIENPHAAELFAGQAVSFAVIGGSNITITLATPRWSTVEKKFFHVVVGRLVMPVQGAQGLAAGLYDFLKARGLDPASTGAGTAVQ